ncbi:MAG: hypothetical protein ABL927_04660 [Bdellovibrionales bacterium]
MSDSHYSLPSERLRAIRDDILRRTDQSEYFNVQYQVELLKQKIGGLEKARERLGYSRRKICQELLVDPSAWTRWTKNNIESAPAHVYKMLSFLIDAADRTSNANRTSNYADVKQKAHDLTFIEPKLHDLDLNFSHTEFLSQLAALREESQKLKVQISNREVLSFGWKLMVIINIVLLLYKMFF